MRSRTSVAYTRVSGRQRDDVVKFSPLLSDASSGELCLDLREPDVWVGGPKWRQFDVHCCYVGSC